VSPWSAFQPLYNDPEGRIFDASRRQDRHQGQYDMSRSPSGLRLHAISVGEINSIGFTYVPQQPNTHDDCDYARSWLSEFEQFLSATLASWGVQRYNTVDKIKDFRWKVPIADGMLLFQKKRRAFSELAYQHQVLIGNDSQGRVAATQEYRMAMKVACTYRCPFVLTNGYIGLGPTTMSEGDHVFVVLGADVPFVFRLKHDGTYCLVGDVYVHGIMDGEIAGADSTAQEIIVT